jgi:crossover junction endodeoxyribonuclease RusA
VSVLAQFFIPGTPAPQGSKRHVGRGILIESSKRVGPWRDAVQKATAAEVDRIAMFNAIDFPVAVTTHFRVLRPKTVKAEYPTSLAVGDGDKLTRATWDGLVKGGMLADDKYACEWRGSKRYARSGEPTGCVVTITDLGEL